MGRRTNVAGIHNFVGNVLGFYEWGGGRVSEKKTAIGVPGCERPSPQQTHFQAGQGAHLQDKGGLVWLDVSGHRARGSVSRRGNDAPR